MQLDGVDEGNVPLGVSVNVTWVPLKARFANGSKDISALVCILSSSEPSM